MELTRQGYRAFNREGLDAWLQALAEDLWFEDRRPGSPHFGFGRMNKAEAIEYTDELSNLASEPPQRSIAEVIAVRGEALAAFVERIDLGNDVVMHHINCIMFDVTLGQLTRVVRLDVDDRNAAIALLNEWHAETGKTA